MFENTTTRTVANDASGDDRAASLLAIMGDSVRRSLGCTALFDETSRFLAVSAAWAAACGFEGDRHIGRPVAELVSNLTPDAIERHLRASGGEPALSEAEVFTDSTGRSRIFQCEYRPLFGEAGSPGPYCINAFDVTSLIEARHRAQADSKWLERALDAARIGVIEIDYLSQTIWNSTEAVNILGEPAHFGEPKTRAWPMCHPDDRDRLDRHLSNPSPGRLEPIDFRIVRPSGETRWIEIRSLIEFAPKGAPVRVTVLVTDIDERKRQDLALAQTRQELQVNVERLNLALGGARAGVAEFDFKAKQIWCSPQFVELTGRSLAFEDFDSDVWPMCHPNDHAKFRAVVGNWTQSHHEPFDFRILLPSGDIRWVEAHGMRELDATGAPTRVVALLLDIDERKRQELALGEARRQVQVNAERLRLALDAAGAGVFETNFKTGTFWCSPQLTKIIGAELTFEEACRAWPMIHPEDAARLDTMAGEAMQSGGAHCMEMRIVLPSGDVRWIETCIENHGGAVGDAERVVGLVLDIDDRKRQEFALVDARRTAQAAVEIKSQFLANMSHELRTPMNGVLGVLHLLSNEPLSVRGGKLLKEADNCGRMLAQLLNDIVDFSKMEAGRLELAPEPVNPAEALEGVASLLRADAVNKGVELRTLVSGDASVLVDPVRLRQILFNLIGNAVKFTDRGHVEARLSVHGDSSGGMRLRLEVEDTGIGIPEAAQASLFQRFQQADGSTSRRFGGAGLGLAIVRSIAGLMGGEVDLSSVEGEGSLFWFDAPVLVATAAAEADAQDEGSIEGRRILLVEDNAVNRMVICKMLEALGARVDTACDGVDGLEAVQTGRYDLVLMDVQMPRMNGVEATRRIRALPGPFGRTPIVGLTANALDHQWRSYRSAGMDAVVAKPVSPAALIKALVQLSPAAAPDAVSTG